MVIAAGSSASIVTVVAEASQEFDPTESDPTQSGFIDVNANTINVGEHLLDTGDEVSYSNGGGISIGGIIGQLSGGLVEGADARCVRRGVAHSGARADKGRRRYR